MFDTLSQQINSSILSQETLTWDHMCPAHQESSGLGQFPWEVPDSLAPTLDNLMSQTALTRSSLYWPRDWW